MEINNGIQIIV